MTDENSVLIIGAGASVPFGLPTGDTLMSDISINLDAQINTIRERSRTGFSASILTPLNNPQSTLSLIYFQALLLKNQPCADGDMVHSTFPDYLLEDKLYKDVEKYQKLSTLIKDQTSDSIDDFIVLNPSYRELTKIAVASELFRKLYRKNSSSNLYELNPVGKRSLEFPLENHSDEVSGTFKAERNWIHRLINLVRLGVREGRVTSENKVCIVTFNYDTILEAVFDKQFHNFESSEKLNWRDLVEVIHVHGSFGELADTVQYPSEVVWNWASGISVIRERNSDELTADQRLARQKVLAANKLYFCGFSFAQANVDLLEINKEGVRSGFTGSIWKEFFVYNHDGDIGVSNAANAALQSSLPLKTGPDRSIYEQTKIGIGNWIRAGTLGPMP